MMYSAHATQTPPERRREGGRERGREGKREGEREGRERECNVYIQKSKESLT